MSSTALKKRGVTVAESNSGGSAVAKDIRNQNLLERVQAFANLRFPPVITALKKETDQGEVDAIQMEQVLDLVIFFLGEIPHQDALEFV